MPTKTDHGTQWNEEKLPSTHSSAPARNEVILPTPSTNGLIESPESHRLHGYPQDTTEDCLDDTASSQLFEDGQKDLALLEHLDKSAVTPYPSLAVTRGTGKSLQDTRQLLSRFLKSPTPEFNGRAASTQAASVLPNTIPENNRVISKADMLKSYSLPEWPTSMPENVVKFGLKRNISKRRSERIQLPAKAQPKASNGFWGMRGGFRPEKKPIQERELPSRARSHSGINRQTPVKKNPLMDIPSRPHTVTTQANVERITHVGKTQWGSVDPDLINPRLLVDVLESENVNVTAKDLFNLSDWKEYNDFRHFYKDNQYDIHPGMPKDLQYDYKIPTKHYQDATRILPRPTPHDNQQKILLRRMLRPKHGQQRLKEGGLQRIIPEEKASNYHESRADSSNINGMSSNNETNKLSLHLRLDAVPDENSCKGTSDADRRRASQHIRRGSCLRSPRMGRPIPEETDTTVVPLSLHSKDPQSKLSPAQFKNYYQLAQANHSKRCKTPSNTSTMPNIHQQNRKLKTTLNKDNEADDPNQIPMPNFKMDIEIKRKEPRPPERFVPVVNKTGSQLSRMSQLMTVPSNTPVLSFTSSQDLLDRILD